MLKLKVSKTGVRIDKFLMEYLSETPLLNEEYKSLLSRQFITNNIQEFVQINGNSKFKQSYKLKVDDELSVNIDILSGLVMEKVAKDKLLHDFVPTVGSFQIVRENDDYMIVNKSPGIVVHPGVGHHKDTLANYVENYYRESVIDTTGLVRSGIVHRLDKPVGGLMLFAKNRRMQLHLKNQFESHSVLKVYLAHIHRPGKTTTPKSIWEGWNVDLEETISTELNKLKDSWASSADMDGFTKFEGVITRDSTNRKRMLVKELAGSGREFMHWYKQVGDNYILIRLSTGRKHQIRASIRSMGNVITGDTLYGEGSQYDGSEIGLRSICIGFRDDSDQHIVEQYIGIPSLS